MSDYGSLTNTEYAYEQKNEGKVKLKRTLMIVGYVVYLLAFFIFCMATKLLMLFAIGPLTLYIIFLCTWRLVKFDCYWEFSKGSLEIGKIKVNKNGRRKSPKLSIHIKDALDISVYEGAHQLADVKRIYDYSESPTSDKRIYIIFEERGERSAAIIEATARLATLLTSFCDRAHDIKGKPFHG
ncbi:MAG: hypothetical protein IKC32_00285 [Clostridia bacterium]|nr:hypothetical protein [Clostridia bacterium]